jgi:hypothetical protein
LNSSRTNVEVPVGEFTSDRKDSSMKVTLLDETPTTVTIDMDEEARAAFVQVVGVDNAFLEELLQHPLPWVIGVDQYLRLEALAEKSEFFDFWDAIPLPEDLR